jgi:hypothetical protein
LKLEIFLDKADDGYDERSESLLKERQDMLFSILSSVKPMTGHGYFNIDKPMITSIIGAAITYIVILVQFNMSEKPLRNSTT